MIDLDRVIRSAVRSRKIYLGSKRTLDAARSGKAAVIITSSNCPDRLRRVIEYHTSLSGTPIWTYRGPSLELGEACEKNFPVSALAVREITEPELLRMVKEQGSEAD
jgi:large subunit ribosomal protein L30e